MSATRHGNKVVAHVWGDEAANIGVNFYQGFLFRSKEVLKARNALSEEEKQQLNRAAYADAVRV